MPTPGVAARARLAELDRGFARYLAKYQESKIFSGPSVYFYEEAVGRVREVPEADGLRSDRRLAEMIYGISPRD
jgi:hypothetical protein